VGGMDAPRRQRRITGCQRGEVLVGEDSRPLIC